MASQPNSGSPREWWIDASGMPQHPNPRKQIVGRRINYLRRINRNESKETLARAIGITAPAISQWENGDTVPSSENIMSMAIHYDVSTDYILCLEFHQLTDEQLRALPIEVIERSPYTKTGLPIKLGNHRNQ